MERLKEKHPSVPFNPAIANAFFRAGRTEAWGRGTLKIFEECRKSGIPEPVFKYELLGFWIEFSLGSDAGSEKSSEKILELLEKDNRITISQLASALNISTRAVEKHFSSLKKEIRLKRIGGKKDGYWELKSFSK